MRRATATLSIARPAALREELRTALPERPFTVQFWDGSTLEATAPGPTITVRSPRAVAYLLSAPGELGLGRAYVTGELDVNDLDALVGLINQWHAPELDTKQRARLAIAAVRAAGIQRLPTPPASEIRPKGMLHGLRRDSSAIQHRRVRQPALQVPAARRPTAQSRHRAPSPSGVGPGTVL